MLVLALDCSTSRGSLALGRAGAAGPCQVVRAGEFAAGRGCGGKMFTLLEEFLHDARATGESLAGLVVGLGPGSYSGVRQAVAAATGLAAATGASLRGVPSVLALAPGPAPFHAVGDARRGTYYYTAVSSGLCQDGGPELLADAAALSARLAAHPDWPVYAMESALPGGLLPTAEIRLPDAARLLAAPEAAGWPPPLEPIYLRPVSITLPKVVNPGTP